MPRSSTPRCFIAVTAVLAATVDSTVAQTTHRAPLGGSVAYTTSTGTDDRSGAFFEAGEDIFGPFEAGFDSSQDNGLRAMGCTDPSDGYLAAGIDTATAEQLIAFQCGVTLPRVEGGELIGLLDECGGHTNSYHFHEQLSCLYSPTGAHSDQVGEADDGSRHLIYGKWEDADAGIAPALDACGGHYGVTPDSHGEKVYHYHVQDTAPFVIGCYGPNDDGSLVTVQQCRDFYGRCDGNLVTLETADGPFEYDLYCPCFDANGSNSGVDIVELAVFTATAAVTSTATTNTVTETTTTATSSSTTTTTAKAAEGTGEGCCTWNVLKGCQADSTQWCGASEDRCTSRCNGQWLSAAETTAAATTDAATTATTTTVTTTVLDTVALYGKCGGKNYDGPTVCADGLVCTYLNEWYSQCKRESRRMIRGRRF